MSQVRYYLIIDTNALFVSYDSAGDFIDFSFNSNFNNLVSLIKNLNIESYITILVPDVVYEELKNQKVSAYDKKREQLKKLITDFKFPDLCCKLELKDIDYNEYITDKITEYQGFLASGQVTVDRLPLPTEKRFSYVMERAFAKKPPFSGANKKSDKGFKDTLIWESILEFKENTPQSKLIFYSNDNEFRADLEEEFYNIFNDHIFIYKDYFDVEEQLEKWAKAIDIYVYIPEKPMKSPIDAQLGKKVEELTAHGSLSSVEDIEEKFAATAGKETSEEDV